MFALASRSVSRRPSTRATRRHAETGLGEAILRALARRPTDHRLRRHRERLDAAATRRRRRRLGLAPHLAARSAFAFHAYGQRLALSGSSAAAPGRRAARRMSASSLITARRRAAVRGSTRSASSTSSWTTYEATDQTTATRSPSGGRPGAHVECLPCPPGKPNATARAVAGAQRVGGIDCTYRTRAVWPPRGNGAFGAQLDAAHAIPPTSSRLPPHPRGRSPRASAAFAAHIDARSRLEETLDTKCVEQARGYRVQREPRSRARPAPPAQPPRGTG